MKALPYTRGDIAANRAGSMSLAQSARLREDIVTIQANISSHLFEIGMVGLGLLLVLLIGGVQMTVLSATLVLVAVLMLLFERLEGVRLRRLRADLDQRRVQWVAGAVQLQTWLDRAGIKRYGVKLGAMQFQVAPHVYRAIDSTQHYRVYFAPVSGALLSIEVLEG